MCRTLPKGRQSGGHEAESVADFGVSDSINPHDGDSPADAMILPDDGKQLAHGVTRVPYRAWWSLGEKIDLYAQEMRARGLGEKTVEGETWALRNMFRALWAEGFDVLPRRVSQFHVDYLREIHYEGRAQWYVGHNLSILKQFLRWAGNRQTDRFRWPVRGYLRPNADWLGDGEAMLVRESARALERIIVHCELDLGLRGIEVLRLKTSDFRTGRQNSVRVHGKGRNGGRFRGIPRHPGTAL